jgi:hypothetical protein
VAEARILESRGLRWGVGGVALSTQQADYTQQKSTWAMYSFDILYFLRFFCC